jgi:signal transduction histidine kinase
MYRNATRIQKLTKDILDVTRIESDTLRLNKIKFDLKEVILNAIQDTKLMFLLGSNEVKLEFRNMNVGEEPVNHSDDIFVVGDRNRIMQVISNLLDNALKFNYNSTLSYIAIVATVHVIISCHKIEYTALHTSQKAVNGLDNIRYIF